MKTKYKEIFKLKRMLEKEGIPFDWIEHNGYSKEQIEALKSIAPDIWEKYHICYPKGSFTNSDGRWISVIEGFGTFGAEEDRLEIMGGLTPWEKFAFGNEPIGGLTARNVFNRIKKDYYKEEK